MARLFSALVPPAAVLAELDTAIRPVRDRYPRLRWAAPERWHVTLGFFGDDDDARRRSAWLRRRAAGRPAPQLRLHGAGTFPGVLWVAVEPATGADRRALARLAQAAGGGRADRKPFRAHLTVARWNGRLDRHAMQDVLAGALTPLGGSWFWPVEVVLLRSDPEQEPGQGPTYTVMDRVPLAARR